LRTYVDNNGKPGDFFLTGSSTPNEKISLHSGAGRFSKIVLDTLTTFELKKTKNEFSITKLFEEDFPIQINENLTKFSELSDMIVIGG
jgi:hypothetical protein